MTSTNNITGDRLVSKPNSDKFRDNFNAIFRQPKPADKSIKKSNR